MSAAPVSPTATDLLQNAGKPQPAPFVPRLEGFVPPSLPTRVPEAKPKAGIKEQITDAIKSEWAPSFMLRQLEAAGPSDPNFKGVFGDDENFQRYTTGLDPSFWPALANASSDREAMIIQSQMRDLQDARNTLEQAGWTGTALRFAAGLADPAAIALGAVTGGGAWASKGALAARMVKHGLIAAGGAAAFESYMVNQDPQRDTGDMFRAVAGSFVLGSGLSALGSAIKMRRAVEGIQNDAAFRDMVGSGWAMGAASQGQFWSPEVRAKIASELLTENGRMKFHDQITPEARRATVDLLIDGAGLDPIEHADFIEAIRKIDPDEFVQRFVQPETPIEVPVPDETIAAEPQPAAPTPPANAGTPPASATPAAPGVAPAAPGVLPPAPPPPPPKDAFGFQPKHVSSAISDMTGVRLDIASMLGGSESPTMRLALRYSAQDALLAKQASGASKGKFVPATDSGTEWVRREYRRQIGNFATTYNSLSDRFYEANGGNWLNAGKLKRQFDSAVSRAVRSDQAYNLATDAVKEAADMGRQHIDYVLNVAQSHQVPGAIDVKSNANYLSRLWSRAAITGYQNKYGVDFVNDLVAGSIRAKYANMDPAIADRVAKGFLKKIMRFGEGLDIDKARLHNLGAEDLTQLLKTEIPSITPQELARILDQAIPKELGVTTNRLRDRTLLDETFAKTAPDGTSVQLQDLLENSFPKVVSLYTRQMLGASAESEIVRGMSAKTGARLNSYDDVRGYIEREMESLGIDKVRRQKELGTLDIVRGYLRGMPTGKVLGAVAGDSQAGQILRVLRGYNYVRSSGGFGIAQIPELVGALFEPGFAVLSKQMPILGEVFSRAKDGKLSNELLSFLEATTGIGLDSHIEQFAGHLDDFGTDFQMALTKGERVLHRANRVASQLSGFTAIDALSRRWTAVAAVQRLADIAAGRKLSTKRLLELGLTDVQAQAIARQFNDPNAVESVTGMFGRKVKRINFDNWTDPQAKSDFLVAVDKWANRVVQTNDIGSVNRFLTDEVGKTLFQFRSFVVNGWAKNSLHRLQMHDYQAAVGAIAAWIAGSLAYMGQTYVQSLGRQDADRFRKERLTAKNVSLVGWSRSGWASVLPGVIDNGLSIGGFDPLFKFGRNSGMQTTGLLQNPTAQLGDAAIKTVSAGVKEMREALGGKRHRFIRSEAQAGVNLMPFQQVIGVKNLLDSYVTSRPKQ